MPPGRRETREGALVEAFVRLADTLVDDFDVLDLLHSLAGYCVRLLDIDAAGLLVSDQRGGLRVVSSSDEHAHLIELLQLETDQGPGLDCVRDGNPVDVPDLAAGAPRWPRYAELALDKGFGSVHTRPMRLRAETVGALDLFRRTPGPVPDDDLRVAQALADTATIGILSERAIRERGLLAEQLQSALTSRIVIEQAKGMLATRGGLTMNEAFAALRGYARNHNQRLGAVATAVVDGTLDGDEVLPRRGQPEPADSADAAGPDRPDEPDDSDESVEESD